MKILILLALLQLNTAEDCNACLHEKCHRKQVVIETPNFISLVKVHAVDYTNKIIYCEYISDNFKTFIAAIFIDENKVRGFHRVGKYSLSVNQVTKDVYVASNLGNFKFNPYNESAFENYFNSHLSHIQYHDGKLYFSKKNLLYTYTLDSNNFTLIFSNYYHYNIKYFIVDRNNDIYFKNENDAMYKIDREKPTSTYFCNENFEMSLDRYGDAVFNSNKKLYKVNNVTNKLVDIGSFNFENDFKPVFDWNNDILFVELDTLYVLEGTDESCVVTNGTITKV